MINSNMRTYQYHIYGDRDAYGQPALSAIPVGEAKISIEIASQSIQDSIAYSGCTYIGLTRDAAISDKCVIIYGDEKLKVQYVNPRGRLRLLYLSRL